MITTGQLILFCAIAFFAAAIIFGVSAFYIGIAHRKKIAEAEIGSAEDQAKKILNEAYRIAEAKKKELLVEAKEEIHALRSEADKDIKDRRSEVSRQERRIQQKFADTFGNFRTARFTQLHHRITFAGEHLNQLVNLRRLSGTVDSLETKKMFRRLHTTAN